MTMRDWVFLRSLVLIVVGLIALFFTPEWILMGDEPEWATKLVGIIFIVWGDLLSEIVTR